MLTNATLLRVDAPAAPTPAGKSGWTNGDPLRVRCFVGNDKAADAYAEASRLTEGRASLLRVLSADLARADVAIGTESRVVVQGDTDVAVTYRVRETALRPKGSMSFVECVLTVD